MGNSSMTRRDCARSLLLAAAPAAVRARYTLENNAVRLEIALGREGIVERRFTSKLSNETFALPERDFLLEFDNGATLTTSDLLLKPGPRTADRIELLFVKNSGPMAGLETRVEYRLPAGKPYLRKQIAVRQPRPSGARLMRVDLDNWMGVRRPWRTMRADRLPHGSHPIFCENLWAGVEFVAAFNECGDGGFVLRSRPGGKPVGPDWLTLRSTVVGAAEVGRVRDAFLAYLEDIRLAPPRMVACYNSWWTLPTVVKQEDNLNLIRELKARMYDRHGVFFDIITTDMGWSNPRSIWKIDATTLPNGFADIRAIVEPAGGKLGLWMSPSEVYPPVCDYEWAERNGYVVLSQPDRSGRKRFAISLADPKYRTEVKAQLKSLVRDNGLGHIKYDGFVAEEDRGHHDLLPGKDSVEPLAAYSLELIAASKEQNPDLETEPTYMNSLANYISPWILKYSDTVWGNSGGDCPLGIGPAPDYRESHTNAREYYIFSSQNEFWLPQNAVHYFDIVHCDAATGFPNHAGMAFGRGRFFVSTYLNPKYMTEADWRIYAGLLRWARANRDTLRNTVVLPSRVELGEPYAYAHWLGSRGIVAVRNPSNETRDFVLDLARTGAPKGLSDAVCYSQYPYRSGIAAGLGGASSIPLKLAPWVLLFLEVMPRSELREPVALGARWYRNSDRTMSIAPDWNVDRVRVLAAGGTEQAVPVEARPQPGFQCEVVSVNSRRLPESEWLSAGNKRFPSIDFEVECTATVPPSAKGGKLLLLLQFPGREYRPNRCIAQMGNTPVSLDQSSSESHIGYYWSPDDTVWQGARQYECHWNWYICKVGSGTSRIRFAGAAGHPACRIGLWAWLENDLASLAKPLQVECTEPQMPQYQAETETYGICVRPPASAI